jgi:CBS domain-containing protein
MTTDLVTVTPHETVAQAATVMGRQRTGSALVMDDDRLVGIFTERDIVKALGTDFHAPSDPVAQWMTRNPQTIPPDLDADEALHMMLSQGFRHFPVVDADKVLGVVSIRDLSRAAVDE